MRKESERERIITDSRKKFTILIDKDSNKEQYMEVVDFSKINKQISSIEKLIRMGYREGS
jgi:hypothetical protein